MKTELFKEYGDIEKQIKELESKKDLIKKELQSEMEEQEIDKVESEFGTFFFTTRKTYKYSDTLKAKETEVKELKKAEEETAPFTESKSLSFRAKTQK